MSALTIQVPGISCGGCKAKIEEVVGAVPGVLGVSVDVETKSVHVSGVTMDDAAGVKTAITGLGYAVEEVVPA